MRFHQPLFQEAGAEGGGGGGSTASAEAQPPAQQQQDPSASFDFRALLDEKGSFVEGWQEKLPQDYDAHRKTLANFRDFGSLTKSLSDNMTAARSKVEGMVKVPTDQSTPEEVAAYRAAVGIPEAPEGYELKEPQEKPEGMEWDQEFADGFTKVAHQAGLTKGQVQAIAAWHQERTVHQGQNVQVEGTKLFEQEQAKIREAFGEQTDRRMMEVKRVAATIGLPEDHPVFYRSDSVIALAKVAQLISEDKLITTQQIDNKVSPDSLAKDIMTNPSNPDYKAYNDPSHPRHREMVAYVTDQMKRAYPG